MTAVIDGQLSIFDWMEDFDPAKEATPAAGYPALDDIPVFTEIAEEYKKACEISYINKPLAYALHEVWKKHDRRDTNRNDKRRNESKEGQEPSL